MTLSENLTLFLFTRQATDDDDVIFPTKKKTPTKDTIIIKLLPTVCILTCLLLPELTNTPCLHHQRRGVFMQQHIQ